MSERPHFALGAMLSGVGLAMALCACSSEPQSAPESAPANDACALATDNQATGKTAGYLPNWGTPEGFAHSARLERLEKIMVAFAIPRRDGTVSVDLRDPDFRLALQSQALKGAHISLAVGGAGGSERSRRSILAGFDAGLDNPDQFASQIANAAQEVAQAANTETVGADLDMEFPTDAQSRKFPALVDALHSHGVEDVSMAVAAGKNGDSLRYVAQQLAAKGVQFNVMTYDLNGPWSTKTGPITDVRWMLDEVGKWVAATGSPSQVSFGVQSAGYNFVGAEGPGQSFDHEATSRYFNTKGTVGCADVEPDSLTEDPTTQTTGAITTGRSGWTSLVTPDNALAIKEALRRAYPETGTFVWELTTASDHLINSLS